MKAKVGDLDYEVRELFSRSLSKYFTGVLEAVFGKE